MSNVGADDTAEGSVISLPKGGGAISGLGEKFSPDLFTGTGNFSVSIAVPPGRRGLQPQLADPADPSRVFGWRVTRTHDPLGDLIQCAYLPDQGLEPAHRWDHPLLARISYTDCGDRAAPSFLVEVDFEYEPRPDPFSDYRPGFELRTSLRCRTIRVTTHAGDGVAREYRFS